MFSHMLVQIFTCTFIPTHAHTMHTQSCIHTYMLVHIPVVTHACSYTYSLASTLPLTHAHSPIASILTLAHGLTHMLFTPMFSHTACLCLPSSLMHIPSHTCSVLSRVHIAEVGTSSWELTCHESLPQQCSLTAPAFRLPHPVLQFTLLHHKEGRETLERLTTYRFKF